MPDFINAGGGVVLGFPGTRWHPDLGGREGSDEHRQYIGRRGFLDPSEVTVQFINATRAYIVTPVGDSFRLAADGVLYTLTSVYSVNIDDVEGTWYIYFDLVNGVPTLLADQVAWDLDTVMPVGIIQWDFTNKIAILDAYERHGLTYPSRVHNWAHYSRWTGAAWVQVDATGV